MVPSIPMNNQQSVEIKVLEVMRLLKLLGIAVLIAAGVYGAVAWKKSNDQENAVQGFEALFEVEKMEQKALKEAQLTSTNPLEVFKTWPDAEKKKYLDLLAEVPAKFPETSAGAIAGLKIARWHFEEKNYEKAIEAYKAILDGAAAKKFPLYAALSAEGIGTSYESLLKYDQALASFENSLKAKSNPLKPLAYLGKARNQKALGKIDDAKKTYEALIGEFPATPYEKKARVLMETLSL